MKRFFISVALLAAMPLLAQQAPAANAQSEADTVVAELNGEVITKAKLDQLWERLGERTRNQFDKSGGGKAGFLDSYVRKRLLVQKALQSGFDKRPQVQAELEAARETALFDLYVRDVVAADFITEAELKKFYDDHPDQFDKPERLHLRYLLISTKNRTPAQAREVLGPIMSQLLAERTRILAAGGGAAEIGQKFGEAARKYSEDPTAPQAGDIGWIEKSQLEEKLREGVFSMPTGTISGMLETSAGLQLMFVEGRRSPEKESYESARGAIREFLLASNSQRILESVNRQTAALRSSSKVAVYPDRVR